MDLVNLILDFVKEFASLDSAAKAAGLIGIFIAIWKASFLQPYWEKLGSWKVLVGPVLGLALAVAQMFIGQPFSWGLLWAGLQSGMLSVGIAMVLDAVKAIPGIGERYLAWISFFEKLLAKPATAKASSAKK